MSARGRVLSVLGARFDESVREQFRPVEPKRYEEDADERHRTLGAHFELGASDLAAVVAEERAGFGGVEVPEGFTPLPLPAVVSICRQLLRLRPTDDTMPDVELMFRWDGTPIPADLFGDHADATPAATYLVVTPTRWTPSYPTYSPRTPSSEVRRDRGDGLRECQLADARQLASWFVGPVERLGRGTVRRCWRAGSPWPPALYTGESKPLDPSVVRRVMRQLRHEIEDPWPPQLLRERSRLTFDPADGDCFGSGYPLEGPRAGRARDTFLRVRIPLTADAKRPNDDPELLEEIEGLLGRVMVRADGTVVYPAVGPIDGPADAF